MNFGVQGVWEKIWEEWERERDENNQNTLYKILEKKTNSIFKEYLCLV